MEGLYTDIGGKLKTLAKVLGVAGIVLLVMGLLAGCVFLDEAVLPVLCWLGGLVMGCMCLVGSWFIYGFGQLVDDVHKMNGDAPAAETTELPDL